MVWSSWKWSLGIFLLSGCHLIFSFKDPAPGKDATLDRPFVDGGRNDLFAKDKIAASEIDAQAPPIASLLSAANAVVPEKGGYAIAPWREHFLVLWVEMLPARQSYDVYLADVSPDGSMTSWPMAADIDGIDELRQPSGSVFQAFDLRLVPSLTSEDQFIFYYTMTNDGSTAFHWFFLDMATPTPSMTQVSSEKPLLDASLFPAGDGFGLIYATSDNIMLRTLSSTGAQQNEYTLLSSTGIRFPRSCWIEGQDTKETLFVIWNHSGKITSNLFEIESSITLAKEIGQQQVMDTNINTRNDPMVEKGKSGDVLAVWEHNDDAKNIVRLYFMSFETQTGAPRWSETRELLNTNFYESWDYDLKPVGDRMWIAWESDHETALTQIRLGSLDLASTEAPATIPSSMLSDGLGEFNWPKIATTPNGLVGAFFRGNYRGEKGVFFKLGEGSP
jgi:hypothetical protein